jgi:hypothetical protein
LIVEAPASTFSTRRSLYALWSLRSKGLNAIRFSFSRMLMP